MNQRPVLNDDDSERAVLGSIFLSPEIVDDVSEVLSPEDFGREAYELVFRACQTLANRATTVNYLSVGTVLRETGDYERVGAAMLSALDTEVPANGSWTSYANTVRELAMRRRLTATAVQIIEQARDTTRKIVDVVGMAEEAIHSVGERGATRHAKRFREALNDEWANLEALSNRPDGMTGVPSGLTDLDKILCGFQSPHLVVVAGRPSMGKSAAALGWAVNAALQVQNDEEAVVFFSLEMATSENVHRVLSMEGRVDGTRFRDGRFTPSDWSRMSNSVQRVAGMPLYIDERDHLSVPEIRAECRRIRRAGRHKKIRMIVIDYIQRMRSIGSAGNREQEVAEFSRGGKNMAKEFHCPVIALSQLNRSLEQRADKRPLMSDLRESGAIEQDADEILFIYRDEVYNQQSEDKGLAEIIISKNRVGPKTTVKASFDGSFTAFRDAPADRGGFR